MRPRNPFNVIWLTAGIMLMAAYLHTTAARGQPQPCALPLSEGQVVEGQELAGQLEVLSWNIQKASNAGWAKDLAGLSEGIDLAFIQEAAMEARIPQAIPLDLYPSFAAGYTTATQETGVLTLSAGTPSIHCEFQAWEPWLGTPKATSVTEYPLQDRDDRLLAINLHAINFDLGLDTFVSQFEAIREVLATHEGPILHVAASGIHWTNNAGKNWSRLDIPGSNYYPRSVQSGDGRIFVFAHVGGDNAYGKVDQSIVMDSFRLEKRQ